MERLLPQLHSLGDKIIRVSELGITPGECQETDGHVDQKDPPPVVLVRYPAAQGRTDDWRDQGCHGKQRHRDALLFRREGVQ